MPMKCLELRILYSSCVEATPGVSEWCGMEILGNLADCPTYLAGSVNNLRGIVSISVFNDPTESILNGRIVAFDKVPVDKLNGER